MKYPISVLILLILLVCILGKEQTQNQTNALFLPVSNQDNSENVLIKDDEEV